VLKERLRDPDHGIEPATDRRPVPPVEVELRRTDGQPTELLERQLDPVGLDGAEPHLLGPVTPPQILRVAKPEIAGSLLLLLLSAHLRCQFPRAWSRHSHQLDPPEWVRFAYSGASRPPIPVQAGRPFRSMPATHSGHAGRPFRQMPATPAEGERRWMT
jgi:hypothetical protein